MKKKSLKAKLLLTVGIVLTSSCLMFAQAQSNEKPLEEVAKQRGQELKEILGLTEEQSIQASEIFLSFYNKMRAIRDVSMEQEERRAKVGQYSKERDGELKKMLTSEQWEKLVEQRKKEVAQRQQQRKRR